MPPRRYVRDEKRSTTVSCEPTSLSGQIAVVIRFGSVRLGPTRLFVAATRTRTTKTIHGRRTHSRTLRQTEWCRDERRGTTVDGRRDQETKEVGVRTGGLRTKRRCRQPMRPRRYLGLHCAPRVIVARRGIRESRRVKTKTPLVAGATERGGSERSAAGPLTPRARRDRRRSLFYRGR